MKTRAQKLAYRRSLRHDQTIAEEILWGYLRAKNIGHKCRRQHSIGPYIVDFYFPKKSFVVELDGVGHELRKEYDKSRDEYLRSRGLTVFRFANADVHDSLGGVLDEIFMFLGA